MRFKLPKRKRPRIKGKKRNAETELKIFYVNANGLGDKIQSLKSAVDLQDSDIVAVVETKQIPPRLEGYTKWFSLNRKKTGGGGGIAITVKEELGNMINQIEIAPEETEKEMEVVWVEIDTSVNKKLFVGVYYGKQEKEKLEVVEREFAALSSQIIKLKERGEIVLVGDFNAKIEVVKETENVHQTKSRNGEIMDQMIKNLDLNPISIRSNTGSWTRVNRKKPQEKSIIDYIIMKNETSLKIKENVVDEEGIYRIKGKNETDHNTLMVTVQCQVNKVKRQITRWKTKNKEGWKEFNIKLAQKLDNNGEADYDKLHDIIINTLNETVGKITITTGRNKRKETEEIKRLREKRKMMKTKFEEAIEKKTSQNHIIKAKVNYIQSQVNLREEIERMNIENARDTLQSINREGGTKSDKFWKMRRKYLGANKTEYDTIKEDGTVITDPNEAKEHIAQYYENLYQAREGKPEYQEWTEKIENNVKEITEEMKSKPPIRELTKKEFDKTIQKIKRNKACGPDNIPNEMFKEANTEIKKILLKSMNKIAEAKSIPDQWQKGIITRLYKGKGIKGKCSNERGITLASNVGKVFERMINERAKEQVRMTELQAGGSKGRATVDHILVLKEIITTLRNNKKSTYIVFLDVTKAYDKAWLDAIMYVMHKQGLDDNTWALVKKLNENLTATIRTKHGETRSIKIRDSIRQGGVLSVLQYALLMDEIAKRIQDQNLGVKLENMTSKIGCLLWMDDVLLVSDDPKELEQMLNITNDVASIYHIEFGKAKSNVMKIGRKGKEVEQNLGSMRLDYTDKYKYLGLIQNNKNNLEEQIKSIKGKVEAAYQTTLAIASDSVLKYMEMNTIWENIEMCILPIITYSSETWEPTKKETKEINRVLDSIIKRILQVPTGTPREALYIETGLLDPETIIKRNRVLMENRIIKGNGEMMKSIVENGQKRGWKEGTEKIKSELKISSQDMEQTKKTTEHIIKRKSKEFFKTKMEKEGQDKSKVLYLLEGKRNRWIPGKREKYMDQMTRNQASAVFQARTRMLDVKNNFRNKYKDVICRFCAIDIETQEHVLEKCIDIHVDDTTQISKEELFSDDISKDIAKKIINIKELLKSHSDN